MAWKVTMRHFIIAHLSSQAMGCSFAVMGAAQHAELCFRRTLSLMPADHPSRAHVFLLLARLAIENRNLDLALEV